MLQSLRKSVALPSWSAQAVLTGGTVCAFFWLLIQGHVRPIAVYLLQLYLSF